MSRLRVISIMFGVLCAAGITAVVWSSLVSGVGSLVVEGKPSEAEFVGRWLLDSASLSSVSNRTGGSTRHTELTLRADGRFTGTDFPIEDGFSNPKWLLKSGDGRWELYRNQYWVVDLGFADGFGSPLIIRKRNGKVVALTHSVGGPDSNELWIWRRAKD